MWQFEPDWRRVLCRRWRWGAVPVLALLLLAGWSGRAGLPAQAAPGAPGGLLLSEIRIDQPGSDLDEYFEVAGPPGSPLLGHTYLVLGDSGSNSGVIEVAQSLGAGTVPDPGYFVGAEATFSLGTRHLTATLNFENGDNVTHMLVAGFTGALNDDLDLDDDGALDVEPWTAQLDCLALRETASGGDLTYCPASLGPVDGGVPAHVFRCPDGWRPGAYNPGLVDTPAEANACDAGTPTPTASPTTAPPTATASPLPTASPTATAPATETPTATTTGIPTATATGTAMATATGTPTATATAPPTSVTLSAVTATPAGPGWPVAAAAVLFALTMTVLKWGRRRAG